MKLSNYLKKQNVSVLNFATLIHVGYNTVRNWISGKGKPSKVNIERVFNATDKKVNKKDWESQ